MGGIAIVIQGADFSSKRIGRVTPLGGDIEGLEIVHESSYSGTSAQLSVRYTPSYTSQRGITWSMVSGDSYASINAVTGIVTILEGASSNTITVRATSTADASIYAGASFAVTYNPAPVYATGLAVTLGQPVDNRIQANVSYIPATTNQFGVTWAITSGGTYATVNSTTGIIDIEEGAEGAEIEVTATYTHDSTVVQSAIAEVTYVPTVLPAELNAVWEANYQSASTEYNLDNQTWYYGSKDKAKAAYLRHYRMLGNQIPAMEIVCHAKTKVIAFNDSGTYSKPTTVDYVAYDSEAGEVFLSNYTNINILGKNTRYNNLLVISHYKRPDDWAASASNVIAGGIFGAGDCTNVILRGDRIDFVFDDNNASGVRLPSSAFGKETLEFERLYAELDPDNYTTAGFVKKVLVDTGDGRGFVDYTSSLEAGNVSYYKNSGPNVSGGFKAADCPMYINVSKSTTNTTE